MKIAMIAPVFLPVPAVEGGAVEYLCTELLEGNEKSGEDVFFDVYTKPSARLDGISYKKANIIQVKTSFFLKAYCKIYNILHQLLKSSKEKVPHHEALIRKYLKGHYDVVLVENRFPLFKEIYERTNYKEQLCIHVHNDSQNMKNPPDTIRFVMDKTKVFIAVSDYIKKHYNAIAPNTKSETLLNCVDRSVFYPYDETAQNALRKQYDIQPTDTVILYSGRICDYKGIKELIVAFKSLPADSSVKLIIAGEMAKEGNKTPFEQEIETLCLGLSDRIRFTGSIPYRTMAEIYNITDILVIPSLCDEAFCMVAAEGMATNLPIIATKSGALTDLLQTKGAVLLDKEDNLVENLSQALSRLVNNPPLRKEMGTLCGQHLSATLQIENTQYFERFYQIIKETFQR